MKKLKEYMNVSRRGNIPTRYFARPVASVLLSLLPQFVEKKTTPNRISILAFGLSCSGNTYLFFCLDTDSAENTTTILIWFTIQYFSYVLDCADGQFARKNGMASNGGKILDMLLDLAREIGRLFTLILVFKTETLSSIAFLYLFLRIFWISSWASIELLKVGVSVSASNLGSIKKVSGFKRILLSFSTFMQDGFIDILSGLLIVMFFSYNQQGTWGFSLFYITCIFAISLNIALVFRRVLKND